MSAKYLVTGATGLLGNNIVRQLLQRGVEVRVLLRGRTSDPSLDGLAVEVHQGSVTDAQAVMQAVDGVDSVIHAAGDLHIGWRHWNRVRQVNVEGTRTVATAANRAGVRMTHVSTVDTLAASRDGTPVAEDSPIACKVACTYCVTKRDAEQCVYDEIQRGLAAVIVHPGFMLGPYDWKPSSGRMLLAITKGKALVAPRGGMCGCDVRDVADCTIAASQRGSLGRNYILGGDNLPYFEAWNLIAEVTNSTPPRIRMGPIMQLVVGRTGDVFNSLVTNETDINSAMIRMSAMLNYYSSARAKAELGYRPRPFREAVEASWEWFQRAASPTSVGIRRSTINNDS